MLHADDVKLFLKVWCHEYRASSLVVGVLFVKVGWPIMGFLVDYKTLLSCDVPAKDNRKCPTPQFRADGRQAAFLH
jgi:hypothetical protein